MPLNTFSELSPELRSARREFEKTGEDKADKIGTLYGELTTVSGDVNVEGRNSYVWFKQSGSSHPVQILNREVSPTPGLPVIVGNKPPNTGLEVLEIDISLIEDLDIGQKSIVAHASEHIPGGGDMIWVDPRQISEFAVFPASGLSVSIAYGYYVVGNQTTRFPGLSSLDISGSQPAAANHIAVGIYLDLTTNAIGTIDGTAVLIGASLPLPVWPTNSAPIAIVDLDGVQTTISFVNDIISVKGTLSDSIWKRGAAGDIYYDDGDVGVGTTTTPHAGVGAALLALEGTDSSTDGPHIQTTTPTDNFPLLQVRSYAHDDISINIDSYNDGSWRSSDAGSNYQVIKTGDKLLFNYDSGIAAGSVVTWNTALSILTSGFVGIGTDTPEVALHMIENGDIGKSWSPFSSTVFLIEQGNENVNTGFSFATKSTGTKGILALNFGDENDENLGTFQYDVQTNFLGLGTNNTANRLVIDDAGFVGLNVAAPQDILHAYSTISGFLIWEYDGLDATVRTAIPNGTGDVLYRLTAMYVLRDSAAAVASGTTDVSNGASVNLTVGTNTVRLRVNADGSTDVARTAGADTIKVALLLRWI